MDILQEAVEVKKESCEDEQNQMSIWPLFKTEVKQEIYQENQNDCFNNSGKSYSFENTSEDRKPTLRGLEVEWLQGQVEGFHHEILSKEKIHGKESTHEILSNQTNAHLMQVLYTEDVNIDVKEEVTAFERAQSLAYSSERKSVSVIRCDNKVDNRLDTERCDNKVDHRLDTERCDNNVDQRLDTERQYKSNHSYDTQDCVVELIKSPESRYSVLAGLLKLNTSNLKREAPSTCNDRGTNLPASGYQEKHSKIFPEKELNKYYTLNNSSINIRNLTQLSGEKSFFKHSNRDLTFTGLNNLQLHKRKHTGEKYFKCDICDAAYAQLRSLNRHKRKHTGERPFKCDICDATFSESGPLHQHKRKHTGERPFKCDICDATYARSSYLNEHKRKHTGVKPFKCDICDVTFSQSSTLHTHKRQHTGEKPFTCDTCDAKFSHSSTLHSHKRKHTGEKPFKCDICDATFANLTNFNSHKRVHSGEKPFKCDTCDAQFSQSSTLNSHKRKHTGEKPFKCDICGETFSLLSKLKRHKRKHTG